MAEERKDPEGQQKSGDTFSVNISGVRDSQVAVGKGISQKSLIARGLTPAEVETLQEAIASLREQVEAQAPPEAREEALRQVGNLTQAVTADKPDLTGMQRVKEWFAAHLPALAGAVTSIVVNPIVGKLVEAAGDALVRDFKRRFGG